MNRLSSAQEELATNANEAAYGQTFGYDQYGNRWVTGMTPAKPTGTPNGPTWFNGKNQVMGVGTVYDAAGNLSVLGSGSHAFQWDVEGRKVEDSIVSGGTTYRTWYAYDAEGRRVRKQSSTGAWTVFLYEGRGKMVAEYESVDGAATETNFVYGDHLGSTRVVADAGGAVRKRYDYYPFGEEVGLWNGRSGIEYGGAGGVSQRFTGKERDSETGLDYFGARYMASAMGRFTSPDAPFEDQDEALPQSWNLYTYTRNNPLRYVDPDGRRVRICITGGQCFEVSDGDYPNLQPGNPGVVLPGFNFGRDEIAMQPITCGGQNCGTATYINDNAGMIPIYSPAAAIQDALGIPVPSPSSLGRGIASVARSVVPKLLTSRRTNLLQAAQNPKLRRIIERLYRENAVVGSGRTADAIRHELSSGELLSPKGHFQKGGEMRDALQKMYRNPNLSSGDKQIVKELLSDLQGALSGR